MPTTNETTTIEQPMFTDCANCGSADHREYHCPCSCHGGRRQRATRLANLNDASQQWRSRPDDERFESLFKLQDHVFAQRTNSHAAVVATRSIQAAPVDGVEGGLVLRGERGFAAPTHWSFGQVAALAGAPAGYLRTLPPEMAADCINYGMLKRDVEDVGVLLRADGGQPRLVAATGPGYGRIWNSDIVDALVKRFGDGVSGAWRVPGEFGERVAITKANTTLYASDRDLWVFLADEDNRIELPGRRAGKFGSFARGFFLWNSEVGSKKFGIKTFLYDYTCCNRIVWGAEEVEEFSIRHTKSAPVKFLDQVQPTLAAYAGGSTRGILASIEDARSKKLTGGLANEDAVEEFLSKRFTRTQARAIQAAHMEDEGRPVETLWDAVVGATAYARSIPHQDERVEVETKAGALLRAA